MMNLFQCIGPDLAWLIIIQSAIVAFLYSGITVHIFLKAMLKAKTVQERLLWSYICVVFPFCAVCGYLTTVLSGWEPETAYIFKAALMGILIVASAAFLVVGRKYTISATPNIDKAVAEVQRQTELHKLSGIEAMQLLKRLLHDT